MGHHLLFLIQKRAAEVHTIWMRSHRVDGAGGTPGTETTLLHALLSASNAHLLLLDGWTLSFLVCFALLQHSRVKEAFDLDKTANVGDPQTHVRLFPCKSSAHPKGSSRSL